MLGIQLMSHSPRRADYKHGLPISRRRKHEEALLMDQSIREAERIDHVQSSCDPSFVGLFSARQSSPHALSTHPFSLIRPRILQPLPTSLPTFVFYPTIIYSFILCLSILGVPILFPLIALQLLFFLCPVPF